MRIVEGHRGVARELDGSDIDNVEDLIDAMGVESTVTPTGSSIEAFGLTLDGYDVANSPQGSGPFPDFFIAVPISDPRLGDYIFLPGPLSRMWVADGPDGGVIMIVADASGETELASALDFVDLILPTLALTGG